jgi:superfamily II DNA or RNA helicase
VVQQIMTFDPEAVWQPRRFQADFLSEFQKMDAQEVRDREKLVVYAYPGSGKTYLPVIAGTVAICQGFADRIVVVVPNESLKLQTAEAFADEGIRQYLKYHLPVQAVSNNNLEDNAFQGYITSYQAIACDDLGRHLEFFRKHNVLLVLDEAHRIKENGKTLRHLIELYQAAKFRVLMTGTPFRHDRRKIGFASYLGKIITDIRYGLREALRDRVIVPMDARLLDASMRWIEGKELDTVGDWSNSKESAEKINQMLMSQVYVATLLKDCVKNWQEYKSQSYAGSKLLIVCRGRREHQWPMIPFVMETLANLGVPARQSVYSDGVAADKAISEYKRKSGVDVLVTVNKAYEGLDVKAITHVCCLTRIRSEPWLQQMIGRAMRYDPEAGAWDSQSAKLFAPNDYLMRRAVAHIRLDQEKSAREPGGPRLYVGNSGPGPAQELEEGVTITATDWKAMGMKPSNDEFLSDPVAVMNIENWMRQWGLIGPLEFGLRGLLLARINPRTMRQDLEGSA